MLLGTRHPRGDGHSRSDFLGAAAEGPHLVVTRFQSPPRPRWQTGGTRGELGDGKTRWLGRWLSERATLEHHRRRDAARSLGPRRRPPVLKSLAWTLGNETATGPVGQPLVWMDPVAASLVFGEDATRSGHRAAAVPFPTEPCAAGRVPSRRPMVSGRADVRNPTAISGRQVMCHHASAGPSCWLSSLLRPSSRRPVQRWPAAQRWPLRS